MVVNRLEKRKKKQRLRHARPYGTSVAVECDEDMKQSRHDTKRGVTKTKRRGPPRIASIFHLDVSALFSSIFSSPF